MANIWWEVDQIIFELVTSININNLEQSIGTMFNFLDFFQPNQNVDQRILSFNLSDAGYLREKYSSHSEEIRRLYDYIFNANKNEIKFIQDGKLPFQIRKTAMPICNKILGHNTFVYKCYDCTTHQSAVLCTTCFQKGNHKAHRYIKIQSGGGNCDCGNPDAIDPKGFCIEHPGKADPVEIDPKAQYEFNCYVKQLILWSLKMYENNQKPSAQKLMTAIVICLDQLNNQSLYYNTLTYNLLFADQNQIIHHIFVMGCFQTQLADKATQLFLKMFSLEVFKLQLAAVYLKAYNKLKHFQSSKFQSLYIQLFANNDLVQTVCEREQLALDPRGREYESDIYYNSLHFMGSIRESSALVFFKQLLKKGVVDFKYMDTIQKAIEVEGRELVNIIGEHLNEENSYYSTIKIIISIIKKEPQILDQMIRDYYQKAIQYTHKKNVIVFPFHRILFLLIFAKFDCDLQTIDVEVLMKILALTKEAFILFVKKEICLVLGCLGELAQNYQRPTYFDNYIPLYLTSGCQLIRLDLLMLKISAMLLSKSQNIIMIQNYLFGEAVYQRYESQLMEMKVKTIKSGQIILQQKQERTLSKQQQQIWKAFTFRWNILIEFLCEMVYSARVECITACELHCKSIFYTRMEEDTIKEIFLNCKEIPMDQISLISKYFCGSEIDKATLAKLTNFDKNKKKYLLKENIQGQLIRFDYLTSLVKTQCTFIQNSKTQYQGKIYINYTIQLLRDRVFSSSFLHKFIYNHLHIIYKQSHHQFKMLQEFIAVLKKIYDLFSDHHIIEQTLQEIQLKFGDQSEISNDIKSVLGSSHIHQKEENNEDLKRRKELMKLKKQEKMKNLKMKENAEIFLNKEEAIEQEKEQTADRCIFCRQTDSSLPLCYLTKFKNSNLLQSILKISEKSLFFQSCFHTVHKECFDKFSRNQENVVCPLCKSISNIVLPIESITKNSTLIQTIVVRMESLISTWCEGNKGLLLSECLQFFSQELIIALSEQKTFNPKQLRLAKTLLSFLLFNYQQMTLSTRKQYLNAFFIQPTSPIQGETEQKIYLYRKISFLIEQFLLHWFENGTANRSIINEMFFILKYQQAELLFITLCQITEITSPSHEFIEENQTAIQIVPKINLKLIDFFKPPKTVKQLLLMRDEEEKICKQGHHICVCLICEWKGCFDCKNVKKHMTIDHCSQGILFNLMTGGFVLIWKGPSFVIQTFYVGETGDPWKPKYGVENYNFDQETYLELIESMKSNTLLYYIFHKYEGLRESRVIGEDIILE